MIWKILFSTLQQYNHQCGSSVLRFVHVCDGLHVKIRIFFSRDTQYMACEQMVHMPVVACTYQTGPAHFDRTDPVPKSTASHGAM